MASRYHPEPARKAEHLPVPANLFRSSADVNGRYLWNRCTKCGGIIRRLPEQFQWTHTEETK